MGEIIGLGILSQKIKKILQKAGRRRGNYNLHQTSIGISPPSCSI